MKDVETAMTQPYSRSSLVGKLGYSQIFGSERLTGALLDRLTHHVHILELNGDSYRLAHSKHARKDAAAPAS